MGTTRPRRTPAGTTVARRTPAATGRPVNRGAEVPAGLVLQGSVWAMMNLHAVFGYGARLNSQSFGRSESDPLYLQ
jgi:hypothetical protein